MVPAEDRLKLLECLYESPNGVGLSNISARTGEHVSYVTVMISELMSEGQIRLTDNRTPTFRLSIDERRRMFAREMGHPYSPQQK
jgi:DNA-binding IclR family transcriptional regulator